ncbi:hypothetical protein BACCAP_03870 [Pseudoflavonifractor capillosus ATCC 29799]|uniref:Uncharacterized protein n=1 Tax=Pseudoflavonifractor capillosus ATCC 29799 TaxID=411467 RepID=A6P062_9FIRM|nr:hypothetical protein BACCAP_03870 [Pseudoflavonifractor capillosus ATCC 29799]
MSICFTYVKRFRPVKQPAYKRTPAGPVSGGCSRV